MAALTEEQTLIREQASAWVVDKAPVSAFRALRDAGSGEGYAPATWEAMVEMGWSGILVPEEFGGSNLLSADRIKQPQKGLFGALVIEPADTINVAEDTEVPDGQGSGVMTRLTRSQVTVPARQSGSKSFEPPEPT